MTPWTASIAILLLGSEQAPSVEQCRDLVSRRVYAQALRVCEGLPSDDDPEPLFLVGAAHYGIWRDNVHGAQDHRVLALDSLRAFLTRDEPPASVPRRRLALSLALGAYLGGPGEDDTAVAWADELVKFVHLTTPEHAVLRALYERHRRPLPDVLAKGPQLVVVASGPHEGRRVPEPASTRKVNPTYPDIARQARVQGTIVLEVVVDEQGRPHDIKVLRAIPLLDQAAVDAVRQWRYAPTRIDGELVPVRMRVELTFRLK